MTNSNLVDCTTGRSAGLTPLTLWPVAIVSERPATFRVQTTASVRRPAPAPSPAMDEYWYLRMREHLDRLAAEDDRGNAVTAVRGHDDKVTAFRYRGIDNRPVRTLILDMDPLACDACCLRCMDDGTKNFLGTLLHACFVLSRRVLDHLRVGRERMKIRQDGQYGTWHQFAWPRRCRDRQPSRTVPTRLLGSRCWYTSSSPLKAPRPERAFYSQGRPYDRRYSFRDDRAPAPDPNVTARVLPYRFVQAIQRALEIVRFADHGMVSLRDVSFWKAGRRSRAAACLPEHLGERRTQHR